MTLPAIAILDDSQSVALAAADWGPLRERATLSVFKDPFANEDEAAKALAPFQIIVPMRERTAFTASLIARLPNLKMIALTGARAATLDSAACTAAGILICNTAGDRVTAATAELAFGLMLACARAIPLADSTMRAGGWHAGVPLGTVLSGGRLGIVGLGRLGARVAAYGAAFGMEVIAWSQNLTDEAAVAGGARRVSKAELFATSDAISLHLVLSERTRHAVGAAEIDAMRPGAILINTSRGPLIDSAPLMAALRDGRIRAGLDVFDQEPPPVGHPLRGLPNVILTPHLGYSAEPVFAQFYGESVANIAAFFDGRPIRVMNPDVLKR
jgi:phosphoglycerate dehydrogenase-like enzyme